MGAILLAGLAKAGRLMRQFELINPPERGGGLAQPGGGIGTTSTEH